MPKSSTSKGLLGIGLIFVFACVILFVTGMFAPRAIGFLDGILCPAEMHLDNHVQQQVDQQGNDVEATTTVCVGEGQITVDVTPRLLLILFSLAVAGGVFIVWSFGGIKRVS